MMTKEKFKELENKLAKLKHIQPQAAAEVSRLAELGDFSENTEYQMAKGRLRGINNSILKLENQLNQAQIINVGTTDTVQLGSKVTIEFENKQKKFQILGSAETDPKKGIISHNSPIGSALMGREVGDTVTIKLENREMKYKIINIS